MRQYLRRIRAAIGIGLTWAIPWSIVGMIPRWVLGFNPDAPFPIIFGVLGFAAGVACSGVVALAERRQMDRISLRRFAGWGAAGGLLLAGIFARAASLEWGDVLIVTPTFAIASAISAAGTLALARRAGKRDGAELPRELA